MYNVDDRIELVQDGGKLAPAAGTQGTIVKIKPLRGHEDTLVYYVEWDNFKWAGTPWPAHFFRKGVDLSRVSAVVKEWVKEAPPQLEMPL